MTLSINIKKDEIVSFNLGVVCHKENDIYVAYIPALDLTTHGESVEDVVQAATQASKIFLEELVNMGTTDDVLTELGWEKATSPDAPFPYIPPNIITCQTKPVNIQCHA